MKCVLILFCLMAIPLLMIQNSEALARESHSSIKNLPTQGLQSNVETKDKGKKKSISNSKKSRSSKNEMKEKFKFIVKGKKRKANKPKENKIRKKRKDKGKNKSTSKSKNIRSRRNKKRDKFKLKAKRKNTNKNKAKGNKRLTKKQRRYKGKRKEHRIKMRKKRRENNKRVAKKYKLLNKKKKQENKQVKTSRRKYFKRKRKNRKRKRNKQQQYNRQMRPGLNPAINCTFDFMLDIIDTDKKFRDVLAKLQRMERWYKLLNSKQQRAEGFTQCGINIPPTFCIPFHYLDAATGPTAFGGVAPPPSSCGTINGNTTCGCGPAPPIPPYPNLQTCTKSAAWACSTENITLDRVWIPSKSPPGPNKKPPCFDNSGRSGACCTSTDAGFCTSNCSLSSCAPKMNITKIKSCNAATREEEICSVDSGTGNIEGSVTCTSNCTFPTERFVLTPSMMTHISDVCIPQLRKWTERYTVCNNLKSEGSCGRDCETNTDFFRCQERKCKCENPTWSTTGRCTFEQCLDTIQGTGTATVTDFENCQCECYQQLSTPCTYDTSSPACPNPVFPIDKTTTFPPQTPSPGSGSLDCLSLAQFERLVKIRRDRCLLVGGIDEATNDITNPALNPYTSIPPLPPPLQTPPPPLGPGNGLRPGPRPPVPPPPGCLAPDKRESRNFVDCRYQGREAVPWIYNCKGPYTCSATTSSSSSSNSSSTSPSSFNSTSRFASRRNRLMSQIMKF